MRGPLKAGSSAPGLHVGIELQLVLSCTPPSDTTSMMFLKAVSGRAPFSGAFRLRPRDSLESVLIAVRA